MIYSVTTKRAVWPFWRSVVIDRDQQVGKALGFSARKAKIRALKKAAKPK